MYGCCLGADELSVGFTLLGMCERIADLQSWMRCTVAFSVGYFVNDLLLILVNKYVLVRERARDALRDKCTRSIEVRIVTRKHAERARDQHNA